MGTRLAEVAKDGARVHTDHNCTGKQTTKTKGASKASKQVASGAIKKKSVTGGGSGGLGGKGGSGGTREGGSGGGGKGGGGGGKRGPPRTACDRYRQIKMKCDQTRPVCGLCGRNGHTCVWS